MLSLPKHLARIVRFTNSSGAVEMLRQAQHDILLLIYSPTHLPLLPELKHYFAHKHVALGLQDSEVADF